MKSDTCYSGTVTLRTRKDQRKSGYPITLLCASYCSKDTTMSYMRDTSVATRRSPVLKSTTIGPTWQTTLRNSSPRATHVSGYRAASKKRQDCYSLFLSQNSHGRFTTPSMSL
ncbi:hypothetical protein CLOP_g22388, partial [Closterium sp. NIES-67]